MKRTKKLFIVSGLIAVLGIALLGFHAGCGKDDPPDNTPKTDDKNAEKIEDLGIKHDQPKTYPKKGEEIIAKDVAGQYIGILFRSRDLAKLTVSRASLTAVALDIRMYEATEGKYPQSLEDLAKVSGKTINSYKSSGDKNYKYKFVPGQKSQSNPSNILIYDPVSYNGQIVVLRVDCTVEVIPTEKEMVKRMEAQK